MENAILAASQFIGKAKKEQGVQFAVADVHIGRLEFLPAEAAKDNGYICFYAIAAGKVWYMKAFKGKTERSVKAVEAKEVKVKMEFFINHTFASAYGNTHWRVVAKEGDVELIDDKAYRAQKLATKVKTAL